jgi:hypothetical protein
MTKKSKLSEKGARMPDIRQAGWEEIVSDYSASVRSQESESAKSHRFAAFLNDLFGVQPGFIEDYVSGVEKYVKTKQKDRVLRGQVDNLFGNLVIEFERDLDKMREEAEEQLQRYVACLWSQESERKPYLAIAADGIQFVVYSPTVEDPAQQTLRPEEVQLGVVEEVDLSTLEPAEVYYWLDRYFLRQELLAPTSEAIVQDFGLDSHAFRAASQALLARWRALEGEPVFDVVYDNWAKYLLIVYGASVADEALFIRHTYLSALAKLMAWRRLTGERTADDDQILALLEGRFFKEHGIENFLEEDFFSWVAREGAEEAGVETARRLLSLLQNYNLRELSEDVLKSLYQELVDPETRHDLGEYYTPDWLAHRMVLRILEDDPRRSLLDPSCGSGTFLYQSVREKRARLGDTRQTLAHVLDAVVGVDVHPLAVTVAKTNYILALGDLLKRRRGKISIPVYLADAIKLPQRWAETEMADYKVELDGQTIYLPQALLENPELYDDTIEAAKGFAVQSAGGRPDRDQFLSYLRAQHGHLLSDGAPAQKVFVIADALRRLIEAGRDTIWAFVLKNVYKPLFLKGNFDVVVGNPPWLSFRYAEPEYQAFLKRQITERYNLLSGRGELITHLELATLFLVRAADLYLRDGGLVAFVLPRSIFSADQHDALRRGDFRGVALGFEEVWDLEDVEPLFNVPSCVLFGRKEQRPGPGEGGSPEPVAIPGEVLSGTLERKNAALEEAEESLAVEEETFYLSQIGERSFWSSTASVQAEAASRYKDLFKNGATIYPRAFWFVQIKSSPLGLDPTLPPLESGERAQRYAKGRWKGLVLKGNVESRFLYATLLSTDLLPFGHLDYRPVVLPIEPAGETYGLVTASEARGKGYIHLAQWLETAQAEWEERRGSKADRMDVLEYLNYQGKLTAQNPQAKYRVLYAASATYLCACLFEDEAISFEVGQQEVGAAGFAVDHKSYQFETDNVLEAHYLVATLNAPTVDELVKPMQSRGQYGARDIHKKVLELPIPRFDPSQNVHKELATLGRECAQRVSDWIGGGGPGDVRSISKLRSMVRDLLEEELAEIDELVKPLLDAEA